MGALTDGFMKVWKVDMFRMLFIAAGIMVCFLYFGIMQEKVMRGCFGGEIINKKCEGGDKYEYELTFVGILTLIYAIIARTLLIKLKSPEPDQTHKGWYAAAAFTYLSAMVCGNMALRWITYPTQVIGKSSKPIPVMLIGVLLANKRYTIQKYFFVLLIVVGVILFIYKDDKAKDGDSNNHIGLILIGMSLLSDGVLGAIEDRMRAKTKPSALNFMFSINFFSAIFLAIGAVVTGEVFGFYEFVVKHPDVIWKILSAAAVGSFGQIFIFMMISDFGPLPCSIVTTTRKFFTVLISVIYMGNTLIPRQQLATAIVFAALLADAIWGKKQLCGRNERSAVATEDPDIEKNESNEKKAVEMETLNNKRDNNE